MPEIVNQIEMKFYSEDDGSRSFHMFSYQTCDISITSLPRLRFPSVCNRVETEIRTNFLPVFEAID